MSFYLPHNRVIFHTQGPSMTKQEHKQECDINTILKQYQRTGIIQHIQKQSPLYTDLPNDLDYQNSLNTIIQAETAFDSLPSKVRDSFHNNPEAFLQAMYDPAQRDRLIELGLIAPPEARLTGARDDPALTPTPPSLPSTEG